MVGSIALRWTVYKTHIISTIVDKSLCTMLEPVYKTHIISTIVDYYCRFIQQSAAGNVYKTHIISTIVD